MLLALHTINAFQLNSNSFRSGNQSADTVAVYNAKGQADWYVHVSAVDIGVMLKLTVCPESLSKILIRQNGQGCQVVLCLEICLLTCYPGQQLPPGSQPVRQRCEQQFLLGSNGLN